MMPRASLVRTRICKLQLSAVQADMVDMSELHDAPQHSDMPSEMQRRLCAVQAEVVDISELHDAHQEYLRSAMQECLLSPDKRELRGVIEPALQRILDFRATMGRLRCGVQSHVPAGVSCSCQHEGGAADVSPVGEC